MALALLVAPLVLTSACSGALTSSDWVSQPESGAALGDAPSAFAGDESATASSSDSAPKEGPQRLAHTVTLGEVVVAPRDPAAPAAPATPAPASITINVTSYGAPAPYGYGYAAAPLAPGFSASRTSLTTAHQSGAGPTVPGQSWPAPASAGPSFPFSTSPASPWETRR